MKVIKIVANMLAIHVAILGINNIKLECNLSRILRYNQSSNQIKSINATHSSYTNAIKGDAVENCETP